MNITDIDLSTLGFTFDPNYKNITVKYYKNTLSDCITVASWYADEESDILSIGVAISDSKKHCPKPFSKKKGRDIALLRCIYSPTDEISINEFINMNKELYEKYHDYSNKVFMDTITKIKKRKDIHFSDLPIDLVLNEYMEWVTSKCLHKLERVKEWLHKSNHDEDIIQFYQLYLKDHANEC